MTMTFVDKNIVSEIRKLRLPIDIMARVPRTGVSNVQESHAPMLGS